jgi:hypothetical protein
MANPVDSLPEEYRTPSLESLPRDFQALAVSKIREKFGIKPKANPKAALESASRAFEEASGRLAEDAMQSYYFASYMNQPFTLTDPIQFMVDPTAVEPRTRGRWRVHVDGPGVCNDQIVELNLRSSEIPTQGYIGEMAIARLASPAAPWSAYQASEIRRIS